MGIRVELEMLAVLLLLTPLVSNGLVMPKCQVVDQLMSNIPANVPDHDDLVAKLTCHAEKTSNFDTGLAKQVPMPGVPGSRKTRSASKPTKAPKPPAKPATMPPAKPPTVPPAKPPTMPPAKPTQIPNVQHTTLASNHQNVTHEPMINQTKPPMPPMPPMPPQFNFSHIDDASNNTHTDHASNDTHTDHASNNTHNDHASNSSYTENGMPPPPHRNFNNTDMNSRKKRDVSRLWTLYGVFQLPDRVACTSPSTPSINICKLSCDKLIDNDITDDISCALAIINSKPNMPTNPVGQAGDNRLLSTLTGMLLNSCPNMNYNQYLAECNNQ